MGKIIPFRIESETLLCGKCLDEDGLFYISTELVAVCASCTQQVILRSSPYPDYDKDFPDCNAEEEATPTS